MPMVEPWWPVGQGSGAAGLANGHAEDPALAARRTCAPPECWLWPVVAW